MKFRKEISDADLVRGIQRSDPACFEELFRRYYPLLVSFVTGIIKDHGRAEDIAQSIFMRLWTMRLSFDDRRSVRNWLCVCARNAAIDCLRTRRPVHPDTPFPEIGSGEDIEARVSASDALEILCAAIPDLPAQRSRIFKMSREEHLSNEEIAVRLGLSVRTVEKHIQLALNDLRSKIN